MLNMCATDKITSNSWIKNWWKKTNGVFFLRFCLFIFRERRREGEREGEKHQCVVASRMPHQGPDHNPGMCPDSESNPRLFGLQAGTQSAELHQPGPKINGV